VQSHINTQPANKTINRITEVNSFVALGEIRYSHIQT